MKSAKILIVEDEKDIRELMIFHLSKDRLEVDFAEDGREAYSKLLKNKYQLVVMDWMIPGISGMDLVSWMRKPGHIQRETPVLMVTAKTDPANVVLGLETGADDYVSKPFDFSVLRARAQKLLQRGKKGRPAAGAEISLGDLTLNRESHKALLRGRELDLTYSEFRMLDALLSNRGRALSRKNISKFVQGEDVVVAGRAIDTHISSLRKKLGSYGDKIETVRGVGYRVSRAAGERA